MEGVEFGGQGVMNKAIGAMCIVRGAGVMIVVVEGRHSS